MAQELPHVCDSDENWISVERALDIITQQVVPLEVVERVALRDALGRVLAEDVYSPLQVPNHTNSAMDGYAYKAADLPPSGRARLQVVAQSVAGKPYMGTLDHGQCCRIFTGAVMPMDTDTVVPQERVERDGDYIEIDTNNKAGANVRAAGEDLQIGQLALRKGTQINAAHIGVAASLGLPELTVYRRARVAFFSNGDELRSHGQSLAVGDVYDSNRYTLYAMLHAMGVEMIDLGVVPDEPNAIAQIIEKASACADIVISSAGASVGDLDFMQTISRKKGQVFFNKVAVKPGRPITFARIHDSWYFALPGNPVSVMVTFAVFVRVALRKLMGMNAQNELTMQARASEDIKKSVGRMEFQRATLKFIKNEWMVSITSDQGSGILSSMANSNCFIVLPHDWGKVSAGTMVNVMPFANFNFS